MKWSQRTKTAGIILFSFFILWHAIGIAVVGPFSRSYLRDKLQVLYYDYLTTLHLNRSWPFYAPTPFRGSILSYETVTATGEKKAYPLTQARDKFDHAYFRYTNFYAYLFQDPKYTKQRGYDDSVARFLCQQHQEQNVASITFILHKQKFFSYIDYRNGRRPLDEQFLEKEVFGPYPCTQS